MNKGWNGPFESDTAFMFEFKCRCFLHSPWRYGVLTTQGRDNWDWVGPPSGREHDFQLAKENGDQIGLLLLLCCCVVRLDHLDINTRRGEIMWRPSRGSRLLLRLSALI